jgi:hypothetical protein
MDETPQRTPLPPRRPVTETSYRPPTVGGKGLETFAICSDADAGLFERNDGKRIRIGRRNATIRCNRLELMPPAYFGYAVRLDFPGDPESEYADADCEARIVALFPEFLPK